MVTLRTVRLSIPGHVVGKKNRLRIGKGRLFRDTEIKASIDALTWLVKKEFRGPAMERATIKATFYVRDGAADIDNKLTTLIDCLVKAKALRNDSIARVPGISATAEIVGTEADEWVSVELTELVSEPRKRKPRKQAA